MNNSHLKILIDYLSSGAFQVGDRLPSERELSKELNISRASLREALTTLKVLGIIETKESEGSFLSSASFAEVIEIIFPFINDNHLFDEVNEFRVLIEVTMLKQMDADTDFTQLAPIVEKMKDNPDDQEIIELDYLFHHTIFEITSNQLLVETSHIINTISKLCIKHNRSLQHRDAKRLYQEHLEIYQLLEAKQLHQAAELLEKHIKGVKA